MPYSVPLSDKLTRAGWKVKIRDNERLEPPHVTIMKRMDEWRIGLRDGGFLVPPGGSWRDIPSDLRKVVGEQWSRLIKEWDKRYPSNPISGGNDDDE